MGIPKNNPSENLNSLIDDFIYRNFLLFCKFVLELDISEMHKSWDNVLSQGRDCLIMAPRDHGKSHVIGRAYALWKALTDKYIKEILFIGSDASSAIENLEKLRDMIRDCPHLSYLFSGSTRKYNTMSRITLSNNKVIKAKGMFSQMRGRHPQLIILDDVLSEKNSSTEQLRDQVFNAFFGVVYPMKDKGNSSMRADGYKPQIVIVGTAQNEHDLYHQLIKSDQFVSLKQSAILDANKKIPLWHERYSWDDLMKIKRTVGSLMFAKEYENQPIQEYSSLFPPSLIYPLCDKHLEYKTEYDGENSVFMGVDLSIPGSVDGDFTVITVAEMLSGEHLNVIYIYRARPKKMEEQVEKIIDVCKKFNVTLGYIESNLFQKVYADYIKDNSNLPLQGHNVTHTGKNSPETGLLSFRPLFENKKITFPYKTDSDRMITDQLIKEFSGFIRKNGKLGNFSYHDDVVMSLWHLKSASTKNYFSFAF